jgi:CelD/BcsL family acetyltransferase involved in cellulose biosynthesis
MRHQIRRIATPAALAQLRAEWEELANAAHEASACLSYAYCEVAALRAWAEGATLIVVLLYQDAILQVLWPLTIQRRGLLRVAQAPGCGSREEYGGPLVRGEASAAVLAQALAALRGIAADLLQLGPVADGSALQVALEAAPQSWWRSVLPRRLSGLPGRAIQLRADAQWSAFAATLPKSLRAQLRACNRRLQACGAVQFGWCRTPEDADAVLHWLFANKLRWAHSRALRDSYLEGDGMRSFFSALAQRIELADTPLVAYVKVDGVPVAAAVNLVGPQCVEFFVTTYDPAYRAYSVGSLLIEFVVQWAHAHGRDFDFRPLDAPYKARWSNCMRFYRTPVLFLSRRARWAECTALAGLLGRALRKLCRHGKNLGQA